MKTLISQEVFDGLEQIRMSGRANMFNRRNVQAIADDLGLFEVVIWIEEHPIAYHEGIMNGFEPKKRHS